jgi:two-component system sensor histidine kinase RegB
MERAVADFKAMLPKQALSQALRNLIQNGLDASPPDHMVFVHSTVVLSGDDQRNWLLEISDSGSGMSDDVMRRIGEPFFTTKEVGEGMGLGVFLTRNVIQGVGGDLRFARAPNGGTRCTVKIPLAKMPVAKTPAAEEAPTS